MKIKCSITAFKAYNGFTLIELLVVVLIIGILAAVALPQYNKAVEKSRVTEVISFIKNIEKNMEMFMIEDSDFAAKESVPFVGENAIGNIDVSAAYANLCTRSNAPYMCSADCDLGMCQIHLMRTSSTSAHQDIVVERYPNQTTWTRSCIGLDSIGESVCSSLRSQGWN